MREWQTRPLGELVENLDGRRVPVKEADRKSGPYPYYGASGVVDYVDEFLFEGLHLLVAEDGENLRTRKLPVAFLADGRFWGECPVFCVWLIGSMLPERSKDDDDFERSAGRVAEGLQAA